MRRRLPGVAVALIALLLCVTAPTSSLALLLQPASQPASAPMGEADAVEQQLLARTSLRSGRQWQPNLVQMRVNLHLSRGDIGLDPSLSRRNSHGKATATLALTLVDLRCCLIV